jgi:hypothetical protein
MGGYDFRARRRRVEKLARGKREARGLWIEIQRRAGRRRCPENGTVPRAPLRRASRPTIRDPGAARPDGRWHLATFLARLSARIWSAGDARLKHDLRGPGPRLPIRLAFAHVHTFTPLPPVKGFLTFSPDRNSFPAKGGFPLRSASNQNHLPIRNSILSALPLRYRPGNSHSGD